jgi:SAM-dependent methyltransferase
MLLVFALTLFSSATLLFLVQPMVGKLLLPTLGGTPAVWNTCMVVFQGLLLLGYCYAHLLSRKWSVKSQVLLHAVVLLLPVAPLLWLQFDVGRTVAMLPAPDDGSTVKLFGWLALVLVLLVGMPFFVVSTTAPLLQKWFAGTDHPTARDPYFLYGASNIGSMLALIAYPALIEPRLVLRGSTAWLFDPSQTAFWFWGFLGLIGLIIACGLISTARPAPPQATEPGKLPDAKPEDRPSRIFREHPALFWLRCLVGFPLVVAGLLLPVWLSSVRSTGGGPYETAWEYLGGSGGRAWAPYQVAVYLVAALTVPLTLRWKRPNLAGLWLLLAVVLLLPVWVVWVQETPVPSWPGWDDLFPYLVQVVKLATPWPLYQILTIQVIALLAVLVFRLRRTGGGPAAPEEAPTWLRRLRWVVLAFVPSSVMLGVTAFMTTDIAPMPLLWTMPLAIYLLSFILVFSRPPLWLSVGVVLLLPVACFYAIVRQQGGVAEDGQPFALWRAPIHLYQILAVQCAGLFVVLFARSPRLLHVGMLLLLPLAILGALFASDLAQLLNLRMHEMLLLHLFGLFVVCMVCHGELARTRPPAASLTGFYLLMSLGGVLGGLFNGLIAPLVFDRIVEYPMLLAVPCLLMPQLGLRRSDGSAKLPWLESAFSGTLFAFGVLLTAFLIVRIPIDANDARNWVDSRGWPEPQRSVAMWLAAHFEADRGGLINEDRKSIGTARVLLRQRNFFGSFMVIEKKYDVHGTYHYLSHGTTIHGSQCMEDDRRDEPLSYFHRRGPVGQVFQAVEERHVPRSFRYLMLSVGANSPLTAAADLLANPEETVRPPSDGRLKVGVIGVGTGTLAAYTRPGWQLTLYEIDPAILKVAEDPQYFTYLHDARQRLGDDNVRVRIGDGRLLIDAEPDQSFDLLFLDAFNSDSVPIHLLTREAFAIYKRKLRPNGLLLVNITNRYLDLESTLGNLARDAGLQARCQEGLSNGLVDKNSPHWVALAFDEKDFGILDDLYDEEWYLLPGQGRPAILADPRLVVQEKRVCAPGTMEGLVFSAWPGWWPDVCPGKRSGIECYYNGFGGRMALVFRIDPPLGGVPKTRLLDLEEAPTRKDRGIKVDITVKRLKEYGFVTRRQDDDELSLYLIFRHWRVPRTDDAEPVWTDSYSNLLHIFRW